VTKARKRLLFAIGVALVAVGGLLWWRSWREKAARAALRAEIEAEMAARNPTAVTDGPEDPDKEDLYIQAAAEGDAVQWFTGETLVSEELDRVPWATVPPAAERALQEGAKAFEPMDRILERPIGGLCSGSLWTRKGMFRLVNLAAIRGHAQAARGEWVEAARSARLIKRMAQDLWTVPAAPDDDLYGVFLRRIYESKATGLLADLATRPGLDLKGAEAALEAAGPPWEGPEHLTRLVDMDRDVRDRSCVRMLEPESKEVQLWPRPKTKPLERLEELGKAIVRKTPRLVPPTAAEIRAMRTAAYGWLEAARRGEMSSFAPGGKFDEELAQWPPRSYRPGGNLPQLWRHRFYDYAVVAVSRAAVAIRVFELRNGRSPATLEELVPSVVPEIPLDTFDGKPLLYEVEGKGWRVVSRIWRYSWKDSDGAVEVYPPAEVRFPRQAK
jgi:hypothetical protein